jgi:hypothetical protein
MNSPLDEDGARTTKMMIVRIFTNIAEVGQHTVIITRHQKSSAIQPKVRMTLKKNPLPNRRRTPHSQHIRLHRPELALRIPEMPRQRLARVLLEDADSALDVDGARRRVRRRREVGRFLGAVVVRDHVPDLAAHPEVAVEPGGGGL